MIKRSKAQELSLSVFYVLAVLVIFLLSIDLLIGSLSSIGKDAVASILAVTSNPFVSLFVGLLITALIQSSSVTTSMVVALVASGSLDMHRAIPIIMGANIGTTLTGTIVSLSFITKKEEFKTAFSTALLHNQFNILVTLILFPLQYKYDFLGKISEVVTRMITFNNIQYNDSPYSGILHGRMVISEFILSLVGSPIVTLILAVILLFVSIKLLTNTIYKIFKGTGKVKFENMVFGKPLKSFGWGTGLTSLIQSSSVTTSLIVPVVAAGKIKIKDVYPFIIGANIGTTITALLAAVFKSPAAISVAVAHLLFNLIGGIIFLLVPGVNKVPIIISVWFGELCMKYRIISVIYIIIIFFLLPFAFIYMTK